MVRVVGVERTRKRADPDNARAAGECARAQQRGRRPVPEKESTADAGRAAGRRCLSSAIADEITDPRERAHDGRQRKHMEDAAPESTGVPLVHKRAREAAREMCARPLGGQIVGRSGAQGCDRRGSQLTDLA